MEKRKKNAKEGKIWTSLKSMYQNRKKKSPYTIEVKADGGLRVRKSPSLHRRKSPAQ